MHLLLDFDQIAEAFTGAREPEAPAPPLLFGGERLWFEALAALQGEPWEMEKWRQLLKELAAAYRRGGIHHTTGTELGIALYPADRVPTAVRREVHEVIMEGAETRLPALTPLVRALAVRKATESTLPSGRVFI